VFGNSLEDDLGCAPSLISIVILDQASERPSMTTNPSVSQLPLRAARTALLLLSWWQRATF